MSLTMEGVLALAPDESSAKAARGLTSPAKWPLLGANDAAAWGECQGSGAKPYQTQVDLSGPAFKCSCPSRKFPCKHGLALLLLRAQNAASFTATDAPAWVSEWLASRTERADKKEERERDVALRAEARAARGEAGEGGEAGAGQGAPGDASVKREAQRWQRIEAAGQELQRWLGDQVARGFGALDPSAIQAWRTMAARMVDAQAPGLGQRIQAAADVWRQGADWPERLLARFGLLQLATEALARRSALPASVQADVRTLCGWPLDQADVLASGERVEDRWAVLANITEERDGRLMERRVWLQGELTRQRAWLLEHAHGGKGFAGLWSPGTVVPATLAYFPGGSPMRALVAQRGDDGHVLALAPMNVEPGQLACGLAEAHPWQAEWHAMASRVAANPFSWLHPLVLTSATPLVTEAGTQLVAQGQALPLTLGEQDRWLLLAASGGHALTVMGEWDGEQFKPLTAWAGTDRAPVWTRSHG
ncbi:SWIM zinc finger [Roseateles sp. YR242]|uniref:SWIM zinc finger family protein n=1 Tax=Roseateles sp. YR242 TaxID=1855305 RepID=UPI0008D57817|nr:SWIM zinc finger family protein [Roseateles sp. YR242]SEK78667.1 SWIM zinc finger [Roseateles sp. YR242]